MRVERSLHHAVLALLASVAVGVACAAPDEGPADDPPARAQLEVVLDDSVTTPAEPLVAEGLGGMCVRGDPSSGVPWSVDRLADTVEAIALEHLDALAPRDSARLAARLARTADALPGDTLVADFRGLPVVVRDAWLLLAGPGDTTFIAIASRRLPMESSPLEEQLTLVAAPDTAASARGALSALWFARSAGAEDSLETRDPVLAYRTPGGTLQLLLVREAAREPLAEVLARSDGAWRRRWLGPIVPCD